MAIMTERTPPRRNKHALWHHTWAPHWGGCFRIARQSGQVSSVSLRLHSTTRNNILPSSISPNLVALSVCSLEEHYGSRNLNPLKILPLTKSGYVLLSILWFLRPPQRCRQPCRLIKLNHRLRSLEISWAPLKQIYRSSIKTCFRYRVANPTTQVWASAAYTFETAKPFPMGVSRNCPLTQSDFAWDSLTMRCAAWQGWPLNPKWLCITMYHYVLHVIQCHSICLSYLYFGFHNSIQKIETGPEKTSVGRKKKSFPKGHDFEQNVKNDNRLQWRVSTWHGTNLCVAFIKYWAGMGEKWLAVGAGRISLHIWGSIEHCPKRQNLQANATRFFKNRYDNEEISTWTNQNPTKQAQPKRQRCSIIPSNHTSTISSRNRLSNTWSQEVGGR